MSHTFLRRPRIGGWATGLTVLVVLSVLSSSASVQAAPASQGSGGSHPLYLPAISLHWYGMPPATTFDLINQALQQGTITAEIALEYKAFAVFGDTRLPAMYRAVDVGGGADLVLAEVVGAYPTLSASARSVLTPFLIPPYQAGSWVQHSTGDQAMASPNDWTYLSAVNGKARIWYRKGDAAEQRQAGVIAAELATLIWPNETALMNREPIPGSGGVQNIVLSDVSAGWGGIFEPISPGDSYPVAQTCDNSASLIYLDRHLPDVGSESKPGLVEILAHEFMHALQFSFATQSHSCTDYAWLAEATATWAEDYIYPTHNTEWRGVKEYLLTTDQRLDSNTGNRSSGLYLLVYLHTRRRSDPDAVRRIWLNAARMDSIEALSAIGGVGVDQLEALWNAEPFETFLRNHDGLTEQPEHGRGLLRADTGFAEYILPDVIPTGGIVIDHYEIDPSVRTISILNGLDTVITNEAYNGQMSERIYHQTNSPLNDTLVPEFVTLVRYAGNDQPLVMAHTPRQDFCQDWLKQRVSEIIIIRANNSLTDRGARLTAWGEHSRILVSTVPCMGLQGTASVTTRSGGVVETTTGTGLVFESYVDSNLDPNVDVLGSDVINLHLVAGQIAWSIAGTDEGGCTSSGSGAFTITGAYNPTNLNLFFNLLPGSPHFLAYEGNAYPDGGTEATYTRSCPGRPTDTIPTPVAPFFMADGTGKVYPDGTLVGNVTVSDGSGTTTWEWDLRPDIR